MDCAKLDELAIDLVYDEIHPRAAADAEQHLLGCTRCRALVDRLRAGKKGADSLVLESPSSLLESRIVEAATKAARTRAPVPWPRRVARVVSIAGAYAMRPQIAMAAVVVLMVGMSVVLFRGGVTSPHRTKVTEEGTPVASVEKNAEDDQGALANLDEKPKAKSAGPGAGAGNGAPAAAPAQEEATKDQLDLDHDGLAELEKKKADKSESATGTSGDTLGGEDLPADGKDAKKGMIAGGPPAPAATATAAAASGGKAAEPSSPTYDAAMDNYTKGNFADAAKGFDAAAAAGTRASTATLYAARSFRALGSCGQAFPRFRILATWPASGEVPWAALEGGECARALGDDATAKTLFEQAKTYPATKARAESNLASMQGPPTATKPPASYASPKKAPVMNDSY